MNAEWTYRPQVYCGRKVCFVMKAKMTLPRLLMNVAVLATAFVYSRRGTPPRVLAIITLIAIVIANAAFSWGRGSRRGEALPRVTGLGINGPERSHQAIKPTSLKGRALFLAGLVCGIGLGISYAHETRQWLFIPAGAVVGYVLGQVLLRKYR
jgi:hypothetical protein